MYVCINEKMFVFNSIDLIGSDCIFIYFWNILLKSIISILANNYNNRMFAFDAGNLLTRALHD